MKNTYLLLAAFLFFNFNINAQITEGFETCVNNDDPFGSGDWWDCEGGSDCYFLCSNVQAHSGAWSGLIPGDESRQAVLNLGNQIFGEWGLEFWMYVPSGKVAYWNLRGTVPIGSGEMIVGNVFFNQDNTNPGVGLIDDSALGEVNFNFPHDQWFKVVMNVDLNLGISVATWQLNIDGEDVLPLGTPFTNETGVAPQTLGGVEFFSISADNELYVDDILFVNEFIYPNPDPSIFTDDMESYTDGELINEDHWTNAGCGVGEGCSIMSTSLRAHGGVLSGYIPGDGSTDALLDLGNRIFGEWEILFWAFIPEGKEAAMSIQGTVPYEEDNSVVGGFYFNKNLESPGIGVISDSALGEVSFNFPHDEWFRIYMEWDISSGISAATWYLNIDGVDVLDYGTPFTNENGDTALSLGGIEFFSASTNNEMYLDTFDFTDEFIIFNTDSFENSDFKIYPNPTENLMQIKSNETINNIVIYNVLGKSILNTSNPNNIDTSSLAKGIYFVVVETDKGNGTQKLIKN